MLRFKLHSKFFWGTVLIGACFGNFSWGFETFDQVRARTRPSEGVLYDRNQEVIHEVRIDSEVRQLEWIPLELISRSFRDAVVFSEDKRFWNHQGIDWTAFLHASVKNILSHHPRGASTITMQLASVLDQKLIPKRLRRDFSQKVKQMNGARELEKTWSKKNILEAYLNLVTFRGELRGIAAAAYGLFGKAPHGLDFRESMVLASLIRSPEANVQGVKARACALGKQMKPEYSCEDLEHLFLERGNLRPQLIRPQIALAPHLARRVLKGPKENVTLEKNLQSFVYDSLRRQILAIRGKNAHDAAALVVNNRTGEVVAYVGGVGDLSTASYVDGVRALRQAGSTLKPFLYGLAIENKYLTAASLLDDSPLDMTLSGAVYRPRNYDNDFHGKNISLRTALASSLNVPAVKTLNLVGVDAFVRKLESLGFENMRESDYYGPSLALGSADISLWDLVNAYRVFANGGNWSELRVLKNSPHSKVSRKIYSPQTAFLISDILSDRESRNLTFGLENSLSSKFWTAVKTGTSKDMRDNWCIGFSGLYTVGVWVGNFSGEPMWNVTGVTGAAPAWAEIMKWLHHQKPSRPPRVPSGLVRATSEGTNRPEWFLKGTEPLPHSSWGEDAESETSSYRGQAKITYPANGMVIARDPDIPHENQRIFFGSSEKNPKLRWILNQTETVSSLNPEQPGRYQLSLQDEKGSELDSIHFFVR